MTLKLIFKNAWLAPKHRSYKVNDMTHLCMFFNISLNTNNFAETLSVIFKRVKIRVSQLVNLDDEED
jgi:hypothetical protein